MKYKLIVYLFCFFQIQCSLNNSTEEKVNYVQHDSMQSWCDKSDTSLIHKSRSVQEFIEFSKLFRPDAPDINRCSQIINSNLDFNAIVEVDSTEVIVATHRILLKIVCYVRENSTRSTGINMLERTTGEKPHPITTLGFRDLGIKVSSIDRFVSTDKYLSQLKKSSNVKLIELLETQNAACYTSD